MAVYKMFASWRAGHEAGEAPHQVFITSSATLKQQVRGVRARTGGRRCRRQQRRRRRQRWGIPGARWPAHAE